MVIDKTRKYLKENQDDQKDKFRERDVTVLELVLKRVCSKNKTKKYKKENPKNLKKRIKLYLDKKKM